jgi:membrane associated rhomboid family serine protease
MNSFKAKLSLLYIPFLIISFGFTAAYTFLHWLLFIKVQIFPIKADIVNVILPIALSILPILLWYNRRVKAIRYGGRYKDSFIFQLLVWGTIAVPAILAQFYLGALFGSPDGLGLFLSYVNPAFQPAHIDIALCFFASLLFSHIAVLSLLFFISLDEWEFMRFKARLQPQEEHELNFFFSFFRPKAGYFATPIIMDANILVFLAMCVAGLGFKHFSTAGLFMWGANFRPAVLDGQWWRLLTSTFLHGGAMHLVSNMIGLVFVGTLVEPVLGKRKFAVVYLLAGIIASLNSAWQHVATVSVGASGAIFGLYGVFLALLLAKVFPKDFRRQFLRMSIIFIGYNLAMGFTGNIDNAAHAGGLLTGLAAGFILAPGIKKSRKALMPELPTAEAHSQPGRRYY